MSFGSKSLPPPTEDEARRIEACKSNQCIACLLQHNVTEDREYHHLLLGGRRAGHRIGICLCSWHHRGIPRRGCTHEFMRAAYGPSLAEGSKAFHTRYGSDQFLLDAQDVLIGWPRIKIERQKKAKSRTQRSSKTIPRGKRGVDL